MKLSQLYEKDETAWLEESSRLITAGNYEKLAYQNLQDFLESMARREKRQVRSRLIQLLFHLLTWQFQPEKRSRSWKKTIFQQREQLKSLFASKTLEHGAAEDLEEAYRKTLKLAIAETKLDKSVFPKACPYTFEFLLSDDFPNQ